MINKIILHNIIFFKNSVLLLSTGSFILQLLYFPISSNYVCSAIIYFSSIISTFYIFRPKTIFAYPLSTLMILGYCLYYFFLPPIATLLEEKPIINNLVLPITISFHSSIGLLSLILAHIIYRKLFFFNKIRIFFTHYYKKLNIFKSLNFNQILVISLITLFSQCISIIFKNFKDENILLKFFDGLNFFIFLPYILLASGLIKVKAKNITYLIYFSIFILILGVFFNARSFVFIGYANVFILFFFLYIYGIKSIKFKTSAFIKLIGILLFILVLIEPATKLVVSMALARNIRDEASPIELLKETYYRYRSIDNVSEVIQNFEDLHFEQDIWDEHYINNPFFARLCNLKYIDNIFVINESLTSEDKELAKNQEINKTFSILPLPIIQLLNIQVDKEEATSGSMGDYLFFLTGSIDKIEGSRTGSLIGSAFIIFGWFYPLFLVILTICVFVIGDSFIIFKNNIPTFSPVAFLSFYPFLFFFTSSALGMESISGLLSFVLRGSIQTPIMYFLLLAVTNRVVKIFRLN